MSVFKVGGVSGGWREEDKGEEREKREALS